eukprot:CAMPEP_0185833572 /NCGR_PEP_ID=MMETSP1353-20130828/3107_1 /TAXON_ID=1077150 /ORGANISM="Erythrolobus australicus, Strain CCMP3124" /LENGTH=85 /DNA_ID=CAMNT_0028531883 /DNA_START=54 /DNA_END=311 /DNA_ORIENTATION=+
MDSVEKVMESSVISKLRPMARENKVPQRIAYTYQRKFVEGKYTHLVGKYDRAWCWFTGIGLFCSSLYAAAGMWDMFRNQNKKEGF